MGGTDTGRLSDVVGRRTESGTRLCLTDDRDAPKNVYRAILSGRKRKQKNVRVALVKGHEAACRRIGRHVQGTSERVPLISEGKGTLIYLDKNKREKEGTSPLPKVKHSHCR